MDYVLRSSTCRRFADCSKGETAKLCEQKTDCNYTDNQPRRIEREHQIEQLRPDNYEEEAYVEHKGCWTISGKNIQDEK
jgi:hypothetical protein